MKTILLIESDYDIIENLTEIFELDGYKVLKAMDGKSGVALAQLSIPNLIICEDYKINGNKIFRMLLGRHATNQIPFIFSSSKPEKSYLIKALDLGVNDYIIKPYGAVTILKMAKKWIKYGIQIQSRKSIH